MSSSRDESGRLSRFMETHQFKDERIAFLESRVVQLEVERRQLREVLQAYMAAQATRCQTARREAHERAREALSS